MKKITTITLGLLISLSSFATVRTVNNYIANAAQYSSLPSAITASAYNDTIYIHGSPISYGAITINKKLCLIGAGYNLNNTTNNYNTIIDAITIDTFNFSTIVSITGLTLQGINFGGLYAANIDRANNVIIDRCYFSSIYAFGNNWLIKNCYVVGFISISSICSNIRIFNNLLNSSAYISSGASLVDYPQGVIISNNIIKPTNLSNIYNALITNNIILDNILTNVGCSGNVYNKNLTYTGTSTLVNLPPANNTGSGNINNTNPAFINVPSNAFSFSLLIRDYDFSFASTSPCYNAGTDGTNLGISGGVYGINGNTLDGRTRLPLMQELNINNSVINQGQQLNIQFKARKNN
jgi:hypothetical protein